MHGRDPQSVLAQLFRELAPYTPTLVGTYPLGLQVVSSDLDILCSCEDLEAFERHVARFLEELGGIPFQTARVRLAPEASVTHFPWAEFAIEVFAQALPIHEQMGFRHMVMEGRLLLLGGTALRDAVRGHKLTGLKTEPAFARALKLKGDPYAALLGLEEWSYPRLKGLVDAALGDEEERPLLLQTFTGERRQLEALFAYADDSPREIASYIHAGAVLVAVRGDELVGHIQLVPGEVADSWELKSMAVEPTLRGQGLGRRLVEAGVQKARELGARVLCVSTASAGTGQLRFYQRLGFRMLRVERDVFTVERGYPAELAEDGIAVRDRVWLERTL